MVLTKTLHSWRSEELLAVPSHGITSMTRHYRVNETWDGTVIFRTSHVNLSFSDVRSADQLYEDLKKRSGIKVDRLPGSRLSLRCWEADGHTKIIEAVCSLRDVVLLVEDDVMVRRFTSAHNLMLLRSLIPTAPGGLEAHLLGYDLRSGEVVTPTSSGLSVWFARLLDGVRWGDLVSYVVDTCGQRPVVTYEHTKTA